MRYAIISDIHSNLEALRAVLDGLADTKVDATCCLGDVVGYNANPNECIDILRTEGIHCLMGNHDSRAAGLEEPDDFNPAAARAILWTREQLTPENRRFLHGLPREIRVDGLVLVHGSLHDTDRYILTVNDVQDNFRALRELEPPARIGFFGHTHVRIVFTLSNRSILIEQNENIRITDDRSYLINPGSVGQPRDGDPRAAFAVYDSDTSEISFHRVEYDIRVCQDKIIRAGLPPRLAERLAIGR
ncbi:MAG TPA: metallophosphoesterase family protein [Nitrospirota bacterium]|nr:metallophosphoesterase family protein [Nitrospirota bacterium]